MTTHPDYDFPSLATRIDGNVLVLSFNRPEKVNAINSEMEISLYDALQKAENDDNIRAVLLMGEGRIFSAGHDQEQIAKEQFEELVPSQITGRFWARTGKMLPSWEFSKPLVAAVQGYVGPHANAILMTCDFVIAAEGTRFSFEATKNSETGVIFGPYCLMPFHFPMRALKKLWMAGGWMDPQQALGLHYVQRVVPLGEQEAEGLRHCHYLASLPHGNIRASKKGIHQVYNLIGVLQAMVLGDEDPILDVERTESAAKMLQDLYEKGASGQAKSRDHGHDENISKL